MPQRKPINFSQALHVGRPNLGNRQDFLQRIEQILDNFWLTNNGPLVQEFEEKIAAYIGVKHCIATSNGTLALELAIRALGLCGEVIIPSFTFVATAHALQWQGITPVFCDIDPVTCCIDPARVEALVTPRTTGIIGVHLFGRPCDISALERIADRCNVKLFFDAAHAFGCTRQGSMIGSFGECEIFSFHATKVLNAFEGGAVVTNNDDLAEKIRLMKNFGFAGEDQVIYIGTNGKMTEMSAAMGLTNLESFNSFVAVNRKHWQTCKQCLHGVDGIEMLPYSNEESHNFQYIVLKVDEKRFGMHRDDLKSILEQRNILARRYFAPGCHRMEPYITFYPDAGSKLPVTEALCRQVLVLPTGTQATTAQMEIICEIIRNAGSGRITHRAKSIRGSRIGKGRG